MVKPIYFCRADLPANLLPYASRQSAPAGHQRKPANSAIPATANCAHAPLHRTAARRQAWVSQLSHNVRRVAQECRDRLGLIPTVALGALLSAPLLVILVCAGIVDLLLALPGRSLVPHTSDIAPAAASPGLPQPAARQSLGKASLPTQQVLRSGSVADLALPAVSVEATASSTVRSVAHLAAGARPRAPALVALPVALPRAAEPTLTAMLRPSPYREPLLPRQLDASPGNAVVASKPHVVPQLFSDEDWLPVHIAPSDYLDVFLQDQGLLVDALQIGALICEGEALVRQLTRSTQVEAPARAAVGAPLPLRPAVAERQAVALLWYLMKRAVDVGEAFSEGAIMCIDPDHRVGRYMQALGYERISSHLKGLPGPTIGIDVGQHCPDLALPNRHHHHILCRLVTMPSGETRLFIKPESHGVRGWLAFFLHGVGYAQSVGRRLWPSVFGSNEGNGSRKERIPADLVAEFAWFVEGLADAQVAVAEVGSAARGAGLSHMYTYLRTKLQDADAMSPGRAASLRALCERLAALPHIERRIGNEVIITELCDDAVA